MDDSDERYWDEVDAINLEGFIDGLTSEVSYICDTCLRHCTAIILIVSHIFFAVVDLMSIKTEKNDYLWYFDAGYELKGQCPANCAQIFSSSIAHTTKGY